MSKILNNSTLTKFVTRKWTEINDFWNGQYSDNKIKGLKLQC